MAYELPRKLLHLTIPRNGSLRNEQSVGEINLLFVLERNTLNTQARRWYAPPKQCHEHSLHTLYIPGHEYIARFCRYVLRNILFNINTSFHTHIYTLNEHWHLYRKRSLCIIYWYGYLSAQPKKNKRLWLCSRGCSSLFGGVTAVCTCTGWCVVWSCNILRLLTFMTEMRANSAWNTCWTYKTLSLIHSLMTAPWCWNM